MNPLLAALLLAAAAPVSVQVSPQRVFVEAGERVQSVNFDLIVENRAGEPLDLDEVQLSVFDRAGKLVLRRFIDGNGTRPSIRTADVGEIAPQASAMIFNPFHQFDSAIDLHAMAFELRFSSKDGSRTYTAKTEVKPERYVSRSRLHLPLAGRLIVYDGHDFYAHHRRWDTTIPGLRQLGFRTNFMRYSYDFVPVDAAGNMSSGPEEKNESWFGFGKPVLAAGDGEVVAVRDDQPDDRTFDPATIAAVGAAGSSKFPHLHFEMQSGPDTAAEGLPSSFENFERLQGSRRIRVTSGHVDSGEVVRGRQ